MISPYVADWNETHIYNPNWPPHAKFHNAQTMLLGLLLGLGALWYAWKPNRDAPSWRIHFQVSVGLAAAYWITQSLSILFPGTSFMDPALNAGAPRLVGLPVQLAVDLVVFILLAAAYYLENKVFKQTEGH
jgi:hypothetical protein